MEILLWLVPPVVVTVVAMLWVSWLGREGRGEVSREEGVRRMGEALSKPSTAPRYTPGKAAERSTGLAVRRTPAAPKAAPAPEHTAKPTPDRVVERVTPPAAEVPAKPTNPKPDDLRQVS